ncbi:MAG: hypothetical protein QNJ32_22100 [Xenococcaceae cyanobacterium MO_167.B27]|nr:hypothetical protein [Xenococcaceae cyanobacterium MO_167.B27]
MNNVEWSEFNKLTNCILDDAIWCGISYVNWNCNIKNEYYLGIDTDYLPIEYEWTKWKISEWLQEAWTILGNKGLTSYTNNIDKCEVSIIYLSLINLCCDYLSEWGDYFFDDYLRYLEYLDIKQDHVLEIIRKENIEPDFFLDNQNNQLFDFYSLWILVLRYQKIVAKFLSNYYGGKQQLYSAINKTLKLEIDEDYIYYSLEDFFLSEDSFQRNETEYFLNSQDNEKAYYIYHTNFTVMKILLIFLGVHN